jgi:hypothetical protein
MSFPYGFLKTRRWDELYFESICKDGGVLGGKVQDPDWRLSRRQYYLFHVPGFSHLASGGCHCSFNMTLANYRIGHWKGPLCDGN